VPASTRVFSVGSKVLLAIDWLRPSAEQLQNQPPRAQRTIGQHVTPFCIVPRTEKLESAMQRSRKDFWTPPRDRDMMKGRPTLGESRMVTLNRRSSWPRIVLLLVAGVGALTLLVRNQGTTAKPPADPKAEYASVVQPLLKKYCLTCHSTKDKKGSLDLERFTSLDHVRKEL